MIWTGSTKDGRKFRDHFPSHLIAGINGTDLRIEFTNGSVYQLVGTDNINSLVGANPVGVVLSEYSLQDPDAWNYIRPILAENDGWALFIYTARGKNHGYDLFEMAKKNPRWFCEKLVAGNNGTKREDGTPVISDEIIQEERESGMEEEMIQQEFFCSFESSMVGAYYGKQMLRAEEDKRVTSVPWQPDLPVHTYWDLGMSDSTAIWFCQFAGMEIHLIDYFEHSGEGLPFYAKLLQGGQEGYERFGDFVYGQHFAPHDISARELGTGKSRIETARSLGLKFRVVAKHEVLDGIEAVRGTIPLCWFDEKKCARGLNALRGYRKAYLDEKMKFFKAEPEHDWTSHGADAFRMLAWSRRNTARATQSPQTKARDTHDYLRQ